MDIVSSTLRVLLDYDLPTSVFTIRLSKLAPTSDIYLSFKVDSRTHNSLNCSSDPTATAHTVTNSCYPDHGIPFFSIITDFLPVFDDFSKKIQTRFSEERELRLQKLKLISSNEREGYKRLLF